MADKPDNEHDSAEEPEAPAEAAEPAAPEAAESDAPESSQDAGEPAAEASAEAPADESADAEPTEAAADEASSDEPASDETAPVSASEPSAPVQQLPPKERRRKARSTHSGEARPARSPEERHAERVAERGRKAQRRRARRLQERAKATERRAAAPAPEALAPVHAPTEGKRKVRQGVVVSDKAEKTITVRIDVARRHRRYEKIVRSSNTVHVHDENNDAHEGDVVRVIESRPISRTKRWALVDVLERAQ
jgi:small subunit ribosomal protein S17